MMTKNKTCKLKNNNIIEDSCFVNMLTDLETEVDIFHCKRDLMSLQPLFEAISNSIQANADKITINLHPTKKTNDEFYVNCYTITDNGDGFTEENLARWLKLRSKSKNNDNKKGCKCLGRLSYLKVFNYVEIKSVNKDRQKIVFTFDKDFNDNKIQTINDCNEEKKTKIIFDKIKKTNQKLYTIKDIKAKILKEFMIMFYFYFKITNKTFKISIQFDSTKDKINEVATITNDDILDFKTTCDNEPMEFKICRQTEENKKEYIFTLHYCIQNCEKDGKTITSYCANEREVADFFYKTQELKLYNDNKKNMYFILTSDYFDEKVKDNRDDFDINEKREDFLSPISFTTIEEKLSDLLRQVFEKNGINTERNTTDHLKTTPFLYWYAINNKNHILINKDKQAELAYKQMEKDRKNIFEKISKGEPIQQNKLQISMQTTLTEYMQLRKERLKYVGELIKNKEDNEEKIHDFIFPKGIVLQNDDNYKLLNDVYCNNLWFIDDKFMNYKYALSDKKIQEIKNKIGDKTKALNTKEPDIAVILDNIKSDCTGLFIELKPFDATFNDNEVSELNRYISAFTKSENIKDNYAYLITSNFTTDFEEILTATYWNKISSKDGIYFANKILKQYIFPVETLYNICESRHKLFFEILEKEVEMYNKNTNNSL